MNAIKAIHAKRRQVFSLKEDEAWRDFVNKHTGQTSTKGLSPNQTRALLGALDDMGAARSQKPKRSQLSGPYAKKIQALWISCWNLGLIEEPNDIALNVFATRQANVDHANWIRDQEDAVAVIEALKKMMERKGVDWRIYRGDPKAWALPGYKVARAQWEMINHSHAYADQSFEACVQRIAGVTVGEMKSRDWIEVMNSFGEQVRKLKSEGAVA
jgi:phage gp16-like protein